MKVKVKGRDSFQITHLHTGGQQHREYLKGWGYAFYCTDKKVVKLPKGHKSHSNFKMVTCIRCLEAFAEEAKEKVKWAEEEAKFQREKFIDQHRKAIKQVKVPVTTVREMEITL